jgi:hypothetical protein
MSNEHEIKHTSRRDAVRYVEELLGSDGTRRLAEVMTDRIDWRRVATVTDMEWTETLDVAMAIVNAESQS